MKIFKLKTMENIINTYDDLCLMYGENTIKHLDNYIYWQIQYKNRVNVNNQLVSVEDYFKYHHRKPKLFAGYDYEDDAFTFGQWMQHQSELEEFKQFNY